MTKVDAHDEGGQAQGLRRFHARSAPAQPARGHRRAAHARAARADGAAAQPALRARRGARLMPPTLNPLDLVSKINRDVERSLLRARNGVRYVRGTHAPDARRDAQGGRLAARQGRAVALPQRAGQVRAAGADRAQPRQPQLHPRPAARQQPRRVPHGRRPGRVHARLGRAGRARRRQRPRALRRLLSAARRRGRAARERQRRGDADGLLPRRRPHRAVCRGPRAGAGAQPDPDGDAGRLRPDGRDGRVPARGPAERRRARRRHRQRARGRALPRLLHAGADDRDRAEGDAAGQPLERRVRRGLPGDGAVVARPRAVPRRDRSASWSTSSSARTS